MPRKPRFNLPGIPQHIIQRGNNREPCFFANADYQHYLGDLTEAASKFKCRIHAYVLMTNHVHILATPMVEYGLSRMMQALGRRYVRYFNCSYQRTGTLWEGRYRASLIDSDSYLLTCMRYIELNPVRACMVVHPDEYEWSSYQANARGAKDTLVHNHPIYNNLGASRDERQAAYSELFRGYIDENTVDEIRAAVNQELVLGRSHFKDRINEMTNRQTKPGKPGRPGVGEEGGDYYFFT